MAEKNYHSDNVSFLVYKDWEELVLALDSDEQRGKLFVALFSYACRGKLPEDFTGALKMAFLVMKNTLERDGHKWEETCAKRAVNGAKGGAPKGNQNARKKPAKQPNGCLNDHGQAKQADKDTDTEIDTDIDIDTNIDTGIVTEKETEDDTDNAQSEEDFSAVGLSDEQLRGLVSFSSQQTADHYISKARDWQIKNKRKYKDPYTTIKGWIEAEKAKKPVITEKKPSFDISFFEEQDKNFVQLNQLDDSTR